MVLAAGAVLVTAVLASGPMSVAAAPPEAAPAPEALCRIGDSRLVELSGLATDGSGYVVVNDGVDDPDGRKIFFLNRRCKVSRTVSYPSRPRDTEDLGRGPDGTLWVADIGDNGRNRDTIALWRLAPGSRKPVLHRMSYPDGAHDAEALLVGGDGVPVVVTKDPMTAGLYVPAAELRAGRTTPLRRAGGFGIPGTGTSNPFGFGGRLVVTGGGTSADGKRAVLRTYADAFVFDVPDGDLVRAISEGTPREVALPDEPQGEAVTFSPDGTALLTVSEVTEQAPGGVNMLRYPLPDAGAPAPAAALPSASAEPLVAAGTASPDVRAEQVAQSSGLPAGAALVGGVLAAAGAVLGILAARRRRRSGT
jgi:hypothetical protein